ncbi:glycosyltransferase family 2 protein [Croceibacter atlanticus]|uniref:glycosyltransferase family 2 protein n=3 Tax=Croceibacter atlanticus TaxID=313588 RepID=UPI001C5F1DD5|nr:glycosyltransferase family 2 protein [Croceibacter atlanticus]
MVDISIIIINYNSEDYTVNCIKSLFEHTSTTLKCQYIIVDNGSTKKSYLHVKNYIDSIAKEHPVTLVRSNINTGFGGGNMLGVQHAKGQYLAFVNNDTVLESDCLVVLKKFMDTRPDVGVCGPQAFTDDKKILPTIDHFASPVREIFGRSFLETIQPKKYPKRKRLYSTPQQGQFIAGSFMFFRASDFNTIGGFDTNIFLYYEETDTCRRLAKLNKSAYLVPEASFIHYHGASTEKSVAIKTELKISLLYVVRKHQGLIPFYILLTFLQVRYFISSLVKPKYWSLFYTLFLQAPLTRSLKHKQQITPIY